MLFCVGVKLNFSSWCKNTDWTKRWERYWSRRRWCM